MPIDTIIFRALYASWGCTRSIFASTIAPICARSLANPPALARQASQAFCWEHHWILAAAGRASSVSNFARRRLVEHFLYRRWFQN